MSKLDDAKEVFDVATVRWMHDRLREAEKRLIEEQPRTNCFCTPNDHSQLHSERFIFWTEWLASLEGE